jgi:tRNA(Ile2)-agmatinylcytidine synthase
MLWLGIDDTDSPRGGCTTHTLTEVIRAAGSAGFDLIGEPRLVRLNPNIPWKTRGNAALSARFGRGAGPRRRVGELGGRAIWSFARGRPDRPGRSRELFDIAWSAVTSSASLGEPGTDPALVVADHRLPASLYWRAVREVVEPTEVHRLLQREGALVRTLGSERGIVGAAAAVAWPEGHATWEAIAYRPPARIGRRREVDAGSVHRVQAAIPGLFLCSDPRTRRLLIAPHTACPILFGVRATTGRSAIRALHRIRSETIDRWLLFRTNQGTGDHLITRSAAQIGPYRSAIVTGAVRALPRVRVGGHVELPFVDREGTPLECLAFEPTKTLPQVARTLVPGDRLRVWGSRGRDPVLRLEGIELLSVPRRPVGFAAPRCAPCGRRARSLGRGRGFRCPGCRRRWPPEAARRRWSAPAFGPGTFHPTPSARRHLAPRGPEP